MGGIPDNTDFLGDNDVSTQRSYFNDWLTTNKRMPGGSGFVDVQIVAGSAALPINANGITVRTQNEDLSDILTTLSVSDISPGSEIRLRNIFAEKVTIKHTGHSWDSGSHAGCFYLTLGEDLTLDYGTIYSFKLIGDGWVQMSATSLKKAALSGAGDTSDDDSYITPAALPVGVDAHMAGFSSPIVFNSSVTWLATCNTAMVMMVGGGGGGAGGSAGTLWGVPYYGEAGTNGGATKIGPYSDPDYNYLQAYGGNGGQRRSASVRNPWPGVVDSRRVPISRDSGEESRQSTEDIDGVQRGFWAGDAGDAGTKESPNATGYAHGGAGGYTPNLPDGQSPPGWGGRGGQYTYGWVRFDKGQPYLITIGAGGAGGAGSPAEPNQYYSTDGGDGAPGRMIIIPLT